MSPAGPPKSYRKAIHDIASKLRDAIEPNRATGAVHLSPIRGHTDAYELRLNVERIDAGLFESLVRLGQQALSSGRADDAATNFREPVSIWGEPRPSPNLTANWAGRRPRPK